MSRFLKEFKHRFSGLLGLILVILLAAYLVYSNLNTSSIYHMIRYSLPYVLLGLAVIVAVIKQKHLLAYLVLLIQYSGKALVFLRYVFEFNYSGAFPWKGLLVLVVFLFLLLQVISHAFDTGSTTKAPWTSLAVTLFIVFLVQFYFEGFSGALLLLLLPIVGYIAGTPLISAMLLSFVFIDAPFRLYELIKVGNAVTTDIVKAVFGTVFLVFALIHLVDRIRKDK